jgi:glutathione S-transferase
MTHFVTQKLLSVNRISAADSEEQATMGSFGLTLFELAASDPDVRFSPHCWKVRMALAHKGLEAERIPWRFSEKQKIDFSGPSAVPVLVHDDYVVSDSWKIALHLEAHYADPRSLFGSPEGLALSRFANAWADGVLLAAIARIILLDIHRSLDPRDRDYFRRSREARFGQTLEKVCEDTPSHLMAFRKALAPLRMTLADQDFLSGAAPTYADYCVFGMFMWARCISPVELLEPDDRISVWRDRLLDMFGGMARSSAVAVAA